MPELLLLASAGEHIGLGHLMRCQAIAAAWEDGPVSLRAQVEGNFRLPPGWTEERWMDAAGPAGMGEASLLLVDSYEVQAPTLAELRSRAGLLAAVDDYARLRYPVDLVFAPRLLGVPGPLAEAGGLTLGGPEYLIVRPQVREQPAHEPPPVARRLLLTLGGGSAARDLLAELLAAFAPDWELTVVAGHPETARGLLCSPLAASARILGRVDAAAMAELLAQADLAICAGGQTLCELACLGVPCLAIETGSDQAPNLDAACALGLLPARLRQGQPGLLQALREGLRGLAPLAVRHALSQRMRAAVPGTGAAAICRQLRQHWQARQPGAREC